MITFSTGLLWGLVGVWPRVLVGIGLAMTTIAVVASEVSIAPPPPEPAPHPSPIPPAPQPATPFAQQIATTFLAEGGTPQQAAQLSALHTKMADIIEYDGRQPAPLLKNTSDMGRSFALLQQYYFLSNPTSLANLFPRMESAIAAEATQRRIIGETALPFDATRRTAAAQFYREIGAALATVSR
jgi:hypothetical protein